MLFNSIDFAVFLPIIFILYWFVTNRNLKLQNFLIVSASYLFYGWWDWRFLSLILFSTIVDYSVGRALGTEEDQTKRKLLLWTSIFVNLGFLGFFKYYNFFLDNFVTAFSFFGAEIEANSLNIVLPVGISFYTFQTLSYTIDVYKRKFNSTNDFIAFSAFVSFFPQLVAGPIERATNLLPQFYKKRVLQYGNAIDGIFQITWGLFKKIVIADNAAKLVDIIFAGDSHSGSILLLGAFLFAFQIYGDFSGYSDIAIGTSKLFGFTIMTNFRFPYFSRDIAEFWRRWHISLSTWFRDYLYIPMGGSRGSVWKKVRNTFIIFLVSGFWHGANWTFIIWGGVNAIYFLPLFLTGNNRKNLNIVAEKNFLPSLKEFFNIFITFSLTVFAWIFFRADSVSHAFVYIKGIFDMSIISIPKMTGTENTTMIVVLLMIAVLIIFEWIQRRKEFVFEGINIRSGFVQYFLLSILIAVIFLLGGSQQDFIYFQF